MFASVRPQRWWGRPGLWMSLGMHAALLLTVLFLAARPARENLARAAPAGTAPEAGALPFEEPVSLEEELPFSGEAMTPPELLAGTAIEYTPEARAARLDGTLTAKCVITQEGRVRDCQVTKSLAPMDAVVVKALHDRRYKPVTFRGEPVAVTYTFNVRFNWPR